MGTCVHLLIMKENFQSISWINLLEMSISTFSILKQYGALTLIQIMQEIIVSSLITGKILEGNLIFSITKKNNVLNGRLKDSYRHMLVDAHRNIDANSHMDGRSMNTILITIK